MTKIKFIRYLRTAVNDAFSKPLYEINDVVTVEDKLAQSLIDSGWVVLVQEPKPKTKYTYKPKPKRKYKKKVVKVAETKEATEE